ncbi:MarR family winged helix-turn-helix transcriptional regulator [Nocardioides sp. GCM10027113]|uniref:MarR family winged helix-turn-helix transcriptional regulator n=1 Tax=unclassified Nocardioides TaxID=2615069 RepID=UPI003607CC53
MNDIPAPKPVRTGPGHRGPSAESHGRAEEHSGLPEGGLQTGTLTALRELLDVAARVRPAVARRAALSHSEMSTLEMLFGEPLGPAEIARRLGVTTAASSGIVDRLTERGHVVRTPHPSDRRRTAVTITPSGAAEVIGHLSPMFQGLHEVDAGLAPEQREVVAAYLRGATEALRRLL